MVLPADLDHLDAEALRRLLVEQQRELVWRQTKIDRLTHELALYKRQRYGVRAERLSAEQARLFEETCDADLAAMSAELEALQPEAGQANAAKGQARRRPLPPELPRTDIHHEPESTACGCGCEMRRIGEDIAEKLDYTPGTFTVERHIRGKWVCATCETLVQAPVPAQIIDKGIPTAGLLAQVLIAKYQDHLPLYRQEGIFGRAGLAIPQSTLAQWVGQTGVQLLPLVEALKAELLANPVLHADETPVAMLDPGAGKTHRAYLWSYSLGAFDPIKAVVYDFAESRAGKHAQAFLGEWRGTLICDDYAGYKALIAQGVIEAGCMAHARRKFFDLTVQGQSQVAVEALDTIGELYAIEREAAELDAQARQHLRQEQARPILERLHGWLLQRRGQVPNGSAIARAIDYSLKRWAALTHYVDDGRVPIDNNWIENQIRPIAIGRKNWLFAGSLRAGQRAAAIMSLIQSARLNGHEPFAYLKDILARLPSQPHSRIAELLPHRWQPSNC
jgi:transposase